MFFVECTPCRDYWKLKLLFEGQESHCFFVYLFFFSFKLLDLPRFLSFLEEWKSNCFLHLSYTWGDDLFIKIKMQKFFSSPFSPCSPSSLSCPNSDVIIGPTFPSAKG